MNTIPIFFSCDDNFVKFTVVSIRSLILHSRETEHYAIHVLTAGIRPESESLLTSLSEKNVSVTVENVAEYLKRVGETMPIRDYYSKTTYYRMFIADMFPQYDKAIYLDSDTVLLQDVAELYRQEISDHYVGAVQERVMKQIDRFGDYVEEVLSVPRKDYFNAGVLLINCRMFREEHILERFTEMLSTYNYVVTQDEDYLNVLCKGKVLYLPSTWNVEVFGEIEEKEEEFCLLHYVMTSKPWHYEDCRYGSYFWEAAKKTPVLPELLAILKEYGEDKKKADQMSFLRLMETAGSEIEKEKQKKKRNLAADPENKTEKAKDRLLVLETIAKLEKEGRFDVDVEEDPPTKELKPEDIDYLRKKITSKVKRKLTFHIARKFLNRMLSNRQLIVKEIKGIENYHGLNSGAIITCNHFHAFDSFAMQMTYEASGQRKRKFYRVIREGNYTNFPGFYGMLMRNCNTFPLSSNLETMKKFMRSMDYILQHGDFMLIYPEQSMWWNYRKPKPLKKGAFTFAARNGVPVLPCFITMEDSDVLGEDGFYVQEYTIHISEPIYPDKEKSRAENAEEMCRKNYEVWKKIYEDTYKEPLVYDCGKVV